MRRSLFIRSLLVSIVIVSVFVIPLAVLIGRTADERAITQGRSDALASSIDVVPTILGALEMKPETKLPGVNLLLPDAVNKREAVFGEIYEHNAVDIRNPVASLKYRWAIAGHWKLIVPNAVRLPNAKVELYDLHADPTEVTNRADKNIEKVAELRTMLDAWWKP